MSGRSRRVMRGAAQVLLCLGLLSAAAGACGSPTARPRQSASPPTQSGTLLLVDRSLTVDHEGSPCLHLVVASPSGDLLYGSRLTATVTVAGPAGGAGGSTSGAGTAGSTAPYTFQFAGDGPALTIPLRPPAGWAFGQTYSYAVTVRDTAGKSVRGPASGATGFTAPPAPGSSTTIAFWGDCRNADETGSVLNPHGAQPMPAIFSHIMSAIPSNVQRPTLAVGLGDYRYLSQGVAETAPQLDAEYRLFKAQENTLSSAIPDVLVVGNHEYTTDRSKFHAYPQAFARWFGFGGAVPDPSHRWFVTRWGDVALLDLYTATNYLLSADCKAWAQEPGQGLNDPLFTSARWQVVVMHVALLDSKTHEPYGARGKFQAERNAWVKLLYEHGVDLVMQAHVHYFRVHVSTLYKTPVDYATVGNAGAPEIEVPPLSAGGGYVVGQRIQPGYVIVNFGTGGGTLTPYFCDSSGTRWTTGPSLPIKQH